ncbi:unnamed protein product [Bursaphelenchus okinawaensis]|uniref:Uncharacterized protein n=1 Tax=Bursaphelenchus okinawaensis TaxID=465554 RepID=A0A811KDP5_9BILA|nr:unnamed protein product [Bursaphelenchus okinawaensis]CAG9101688.1 unnamed protein product [Bursaphelenchus okinawaensis]
MKRRQQICGDPDVQPSNPTFNPRTPPYTHEVGPASDQPHPRTTCVPPRNQAGLGVLPLWIQYGQRRGQREE